MDITFSQNLAARIPVRRIVSSIVILFTLMPLIASHVRNDTAVTWAAGPYVVNSSADTADAHPGDGVCADSSGNAYRPFFIDAGPNSVAISGLTIINGHSSGNGGAIYNKSTLTLADAHIVGSDANHYGGGIYNKVACTYYECSPASLTLVNVTITRNSAASGGGIYNLDGTVTVTDSTISANSAFGTDDDDDDDSNNANGVLGTDDVIPFFRVPDRALLANEKNYVPPVDNATSSYASLNLGYVLSQDAYGSMLDLSLSNTTLPIPDLAVGRLVETPADILAMLDAYEATVVAGTPGEIPRPQTALVTGYDFLEDAALAIRSELEAGIGATADSLITLRTLSPLSDDARVWTADVLRAELLANRHDVMFLAGHFSAGSALAADYSTRVLASEVANSSQLLVGSGPVAIGDALVTAKQIYLAETPQLRGIHEKAVLAATLYGLPMLSIDMPFGRTPPSTQPSIAGTPAAFTQNPGATLGLTASDVSIPLNLAHNTVTLESVTDDSTVVASALSGTNGVTTNPVEPVLPLEIRNVHVQGTVLRGVGFRGGSYRICPM